MKIAYIVDTDISEHNSIVTKITSQVSQWEQLGHHTKIISLRSKHRNTPLSNSIICSVSDERLINKAYAYIGAIAQLSTALENYQPDIVYVRYFRYLPGLIGTLNKQARYIVEINTDDIKEQRSTSFFKFIYCQLTRNFLLKNANGFICVTNELKDNTHFAKFNKKSIVIANGINVNAYDNAKRHISYPLRCVFIGTSGQAWHGVEKIIMLATHLKEYCFDIIGIEKEEFDTLNLPNNIYMYGFLPLQESKKIVQNAVVGMSTLSLYQKGMSEASSLKTRQYLAQGLPVIIGYDDTDLMKHQLDFVLHLVNTPTNIEENIVAIRTFIEAMSYYDSNTVIDFAKTNLDLYNKEKRRLSFFKSIINE